MAEGSCIESDVNRYYRFKGLKNDREMRLSPLFIIYVHPFVREDLKIDLLFKDSLFVLHKKKCVPSVRQ